MLSGGVLLLGCGAMGGALLKGWLMDETLHGPFYVATPRHESVAPFLGDARVHFLQDPNAATTTPDIVVCALKPHMIARTLPTYSHLLGPHTLFVSVAAGLPLSFYQRLLPDLTTVRVMPNLASAVGRGISLMCASKTLGGQTQERLNQLLQTTGLVVPVATDDALEALTPLTGCGPAFLFRFMESMARATQALGVDEKTAQDLTRALVVGCGTFLEHSPLPVDSLREAVTSPQGMTWAGLKVLDDHARLDTLLEETLGAARARAKEMRDTHGT